MGYKNEINYILKASSVEEGVTVNNAQIGDLITITKSGSRTFVLNSPIMLANSQWEIVGMCEILESTTSKDATVLKAVVLSKLSDEESLIVTRMVQEGENMKGKFS